MKMMKSQLYYYDDDKVVFTLELNLQNIRRDLINLLEKYNYNDSFAYNGLKCYSSGNSSSENSYWSTTLSMISSDSAYPDDRDQTLMDTYYNAAPPADTLPTPRWSENRARNEHATTTAAILSPTSIKSLNDWIKASIPNVIQSNTRVIFPVPRKVLDQVNYSWPPFPKSIWSDERLKETTDRENILCNKQERDDDGSDGSVEVFFTYFGGVIPKTAGAC